MPHIVGKIKTVSYRLRRNRKHVLGIELVLNYISRYNVIHASIAVLFGYNHKLLNVFKLHLKDKVSNAILKLMLTMGNKEEIKEIKQLALDYKKRWSAISLLQEGKLITIQFGSTGQTIVFITLCHSENC